VTETNIELVKNKSKIKKVIDMKIIKWASKNLKKLDIWDIGCIKWSSILFGAIIGAYITGFVKQNILWFIVLVISLVIRPIYRWFKN